MDLLEMPRLGLVVPPGNPTAEPEFNALVRTGMNVYTSRFPDPGIGDLHRTLEIWNEVLPETLGGFGGMRLDAAVVACSASHYLLGPEGDRSFCAALSEQTGHPVASSTQAILAACAALGLRRLTLVSPYEPWLTDLSANFWEQAGLTVERVIPVPVGTDHYDPYQVTPATLLDRLRAADTSRDAALLFTGTGMGTLDTLARLATESAPEQVLLTSNLTSAWWALRTTDTPTDHPLLHRLDTQTRSGHHSAAA